jgi:ATP-dependent helicase HrpB
MDLTTLSAFGALLELPVADALPALRAALRGKPNAILVAPPGAGKTTTVPLALLDEPWLNGGTILMLEPRRLAARAAATRMSALIGQRVGGLAGYRTRLDSAFSDQTRIEVVTEGLLVRRLQSDPGLEGVGCVIFDEIHERSLNSDLALAFCLDLQRGLRADLRLLAMSATPDSARLATLLDAPVIESAGRMHPVDVRHAARDITNLRDLPDAMARAIRGALAEHAGDILAFLPGMGDIRRTESALAGCGALVLPLHGDLPPAEQDRALTPAASRRVVLATSIAETSLTVPGVRIVIDGGWRRTPRLDPATGLTRLDTLRISRAAADQRAGRAGREAPGVAIRLWTTAQHRGLAPFDRPEIFEAELSGLALDCAAWGAEPAGLPFPDPPPPGALAAAGTLLRELGALDAAGRITEAGRRMAHLGAHPRLSAMMLAAPDAASAALAADLAALLEERDRRRRSWRPIPHPPGRQPISPPPGHASRSRGRHRRAARCRLPRPDRPAARRTRILPPIRRGRCAPEPGRQARPGAAPGGGQPGTKVLGPDQTGGPARPREPAGFDGHAHHQLGRKRLRSDKWSGVFAPPPPLRRIDPGRPHGARGTGRDRRHARWRGRRQA